MLIEMLMPLVAASSAAEPLAECTLSAAAAVAAAAEPAPPELVVASSECWLITSKPMPSAWWLASW